MKYFKHAESTQHIPSNTMSGLEKKYDLKFLMHPYPYTCSSVLNFMCLGLIYPVFTCPTYIEILKDHQLTP